MHILHALKRIDMVSVRKHVHVGEYDGMFAYHSCTLVPKTVPHNIEL